MINNKIIKLPIIICLLIGFVSTFGFVKASENNLFKTHVEIAIDEATKVSQGELDKVVPIVVREFKDALENAKYLYSSSNVTQEELDNAFDRLSSVMHKLSFYKGDKTNLNSLVSNINMLNQSNYTSTSWNNLMAYYNEAITVINDENALVEEVNNIYSNLNNAYNNLELIVNKNNLTVIINKAESLNESEYTKDSWNYLLDKLSKAYSILNNETSNVNSVSQAENDLNNAINSLVTFAANYDTVVNNEPKEEIQVENIEEQKEEVEIKIDEELSKENIEEEINNLTKKIETEKITQETKEEVKDQINSIIVEGKINKEETPSYLAKIIEKLKELILKIF